MRIVNLVEDTDAENDCLCEHGLSYYVETERHRILVDTGASDMFMRNAKTLGINMNRVDALILTHGHYDHAGGILPFADRNFDAKIFIHRAAAGEYYSVHGNDRRYIGIDKQILMLPQVRFLSDSFRLDEEVFVFSNITGKKFWPVGNYQLKEKKGDDYVQDTFAHEQCVVIESEGKHILFCGCAHNGILNILARYREFYNSDPDIVISGFHMKKDEEYSAGEVEIIKETARKLDQMKTKFYTGHCTGEEAYRIMKRILEDKLIWIQSGEEIRL